MRLLTLLLSLVLPTTALAQANELFSERPPKWREEDLDRKFLKSRIQRSLSEGTKDPNCAVVLGGLLTALGEAGLSFHSRDEDVYLDPALTQQLQAQLNNPRFPGTSYFLAMVRRVMIEKRMPRQWLETAQNIYTASPTVDLAKLRYLADGVRPVDSFHFNLAMLRHRFDVEVSRATSNAKATAFDQFKNDYLDREIFWEDLKLVDIKSATRKPKKGEVIVDNGPPAQIATLTWTHVEEARRDDIQSLLRGKKKGPTVKLTVHLQPSQYVDITRLPKGTSVSVRGRIFDLNKNASSIDVRDALLFMDLDWSQTPIADPAAVARCPLAINDLTGVAPNQPGGFGHR